MVNDEHIRAHYVMVVAPRNSGTRCITALKRCFATFNFYAIFCDTPEIHVFAVFVNRTNDVMALVCRPV